MGGREVLTALRAPFATGRVVFVLAAAVAAAGCRVVPYQPYFVELPGPMPADAFARCRALLSDQYGGFLLVDPETFRLQTRWAPWSTGERPAERRATLFRDESGELAVVVEIRVLDLTAFGDARWTALRGDPSQERELGAALLDVLR